MWKLRRRARPAAVAASEDAPPYELPARLTEDAPPYVGHPVPETGRTHLRDGELLVLVVHRPGHDRGCYVYDEANGAMRPVDTPAPEPDALGRQALEPEEFWRAVAARRITLLARWATQLAAAPLERPRDVMRAVGDQLGPTPLGATGMRAEVWGAEASVTWDLPVGVLQRDEIEHAFGTGVEGPMLHPGEHRPVRHRDVVTHPRPVDLDVRYRSPYGPDASASSVRLLVHLQR